MEIIKRTIKGSPFVGVFSVITDAVGLFPKYVEKKEIKGIEDILGVEVIRTNIANSSLLGVFIAGVGKKFIVPNIAEEREIEYLEEAGLKVKKIDASALGNLVALNENACIVSPLIESGETKEIKKFFRINYYQRRVAGNDLPGSSTVVTNKGFIVHPNVSEKEYKELKKLFNVHGTATTANYGDPFVGNDVVANSNGAIVGLYTSGHELIRIDEGLRGD